MYKLNSFKNVLVLAVGGGNDSVSTLLLQLQLSKTFSYNPEKIDIVAVLPDCLDYENLIDTELPLLKKITSDSQRFVGNYLMNAFPERILSQNLNIFKELNVKNLYGILMNDGSLGVSKTLQELVEKNQYDLILSIDVGGDFIAHKDNIDVLSPMMDGYMLYSLKQLKLFIESNNLNTKMLFSIFGLGTDGESTPEMLEKAISLIPDIQEFQFNYQDVLPFFDFYRNIVEKNRYSRTTDYTLLEISNQLHENPSNFRGRFHTKTHINEKSKTYYGVFSHYQNPQYFSKFYIFDNIEHVNNVYSQPCSNGIEWFINVQKMNTKINHELNGQSYFDLDKIFNNENLKNKSLFFGTPSRKFNENLQKQIVDDIYLSLENNVYDYAIIYNEFVKNNHLKNYRINDDLTLIFKNNNDLIQYMRK